MRTRMQRPHLNDLQTAPPWFIHSYTCNDANQLTTMVQNGTTTTYAYNAAGELTTITRNGQSIPLTWTGMGRMNGFGTNAYSYNALGQLVSVNSLRAKSIFGDSAASQVWRDGDTEQLWGLGLAGRFSPTLSEFTLQGVPGSIEMTTAPNGVINGSLEMDAYGDLETATGNLQWGQTPYRYIGGLNCQSEGLAYFGGGTGEGSSYRLIMMGERWYDPQVGRFISRDPVFSENLYAYCANDPVNAVDPEGRAAATIGDVIYKMENPYKYKGIKVTAYEYYGNKGNSMMTHQGFEIEIKGKTYEIGFSGNGTIWGEGLISLTENDYSKKDKSVIWQTNAAQDLVKLGKYISKTNADPPSYLFPFYTCINWISDARDYIIPAPIGYMPPGLWGVNGPLPDGYRSLPYPYGSR